MTGIEHIFLAIVFYLALVAAVIIIVGMGRDGT